MREVCDPPRSAGASGAVNAQGVVVRDVPCLGCGYNLRGLSRAGKCPECGAAVGRALAGNLLSLAEPAWLRRVQRGVDVLLLAALVSFVGTLVVWWLVPRPGLFELVELAQGALLLLGAWWVTTPEPGGLDTTACERTRRIVRAALSIGVGGQLLSLAQLIPGLPEAVNLFLAACVLVGSLATLAGFWFTLVALGRLAQRVPDARLARRAAFVRWALVIGVVVLMVSGGVSFVPIPRQFRLLLSLAGGLTLVVMGLAYLVLIWRLARVLRGIVAAPGGRPAAPGRHPAART